MRALLSSLLMAGHLWAPVSHAAKPTVLVVPVGRGEAFAPTSRVAAALVHELTAQKRVQARLGYFFPEPAVAPEEPPEAPEAMGQAREAFQALEFDGVRLNVKRAIRHYKLHIEAGGSPQGYIDALHLLAATELFDNNREAAVAAMNDAIAFGRQPPSPRMYNPTVQQLHAETLNAPSEGLLTMRANTYALLQLNGKLRRVAPGRVKVRSGLYWVQLFRPGFAPWTEWVRVSPQQPQTLKAKLTRLPTGESELIAGLRESATDPAPNAAVDDAARVAGVGQIVIVYAEPGCKPSRCQVGLRWSVGQRWLRSARLTFAGKPRTTALRLLGQRQPAGGALAQTEQAPSCQFDSDCPHKHRCTRGTCNKDSSVVRTWWFWTLIGAAAVGVAAGVAIPMLLPESPVIEVQ